MDKTKNGCYGAFDRPTTRLNRIVGWMLAGRKARALTQQQLREWQESSCSAYREVGISDETLKQTIDNPEWTLSSENIPENVWFGECLFAQRQTPQVIIYQNSICARLPGGRVFKLAGQAGVDHIIGHLIPFYEHASDYGESVACRYHHNASIVRRGVDHAIAARMIPLVYRFHKRIPLSNYSI